jgi:hypothetical protein
MKLLGSIAELVNLIFRTPGNDTVTITPAEQTISAVTITIPDAILATETVVLEDTAQTLTNKTIDGDNNTVQDLPVTAIKTVLADANKVLLRDASGIVTSALAGNSNLTTGIDAAKLSSGAVSNTEFDYLNGVTSAIQTQLDAKVDENAAITGATNTKITYDAKGLVTAGAALAASDLPTGIDATKIADGSVTNTEFQYINTVTSDVQTQLNGKASSGSNSDITSLSGLTTALSIGQGGTGQTTAQTARNALLPTQTSNNNRFLRTDGTDVSWASTGGGVGKNYLQDQYDADSAISVQQSVGDVLASSTRLNPTFFGSSSAVANLISVSADTSLRPTNNYLIAFASNGQFIETPLFSLDGIDLGKAMAVSFAVTGVGAADDVQTYIARYNSSNVLQERIPIAGIASATTPNSAQVPTGTTTFRGFFIPSSTAGDKYALRILRNANNTSMRIDALVVGPSSIMTGTAITDQSRSYVPTITGVTANPTVGTTTTNIAYYRQVGDKIELNYNIIQTGAGSAGTGTYLISLPSGLSIDTSKLPANSPVIGSATIFNATNRAVFGVQVYDSTRLFLSGIYQAGEGEWGSTFYPISNATLNVRVVASVPVVGWSSNVTMADRAVEEYASNDGSGGVATGTAYDTGMVTGSSGALIPNVTKNSALNDSTTRYKIRFTTPILSTDSLVLELSTDRINWTPLTTQNGATFYNAAGTRISSVCAFNYQNAKTYGIGVNNTPINTTDIYVIFGNTGPFNDTTYGGATTAAWPTTQYWRVRKVSGGAAVGFPIAPANITLIDSADNYAGNTKLGLMQYLGDGTTYNGGIAPTLSGTGLATTRAVFVPYQMSNGTWRLKFNFRVTATSTTGLTITVNGVIFKNVANFFQAVTNYPGGNYGRGLATPNTGQITLSSDLSTTAYSATGDVELESKPTWAY